MSQIYLVGKSSLRVNKKKECQTIGWVQDGFRLLDEFKLMPATLFKKEALAQVFSCEF